MNAPDIRVSTTLPRHRKFKRFKRLVGDGAMEYLVCLWCEVAEQCPTGDLKDWSNGDIADAAGWATGDVATFVDALAEAGFIDGGPMVYRVHDWEEHQSYVVKAPARKARAKKAAAKRWEGTAQTASIDQACSEHAQSMPDAMPSSLPSPDPLPSPLPSPDPAPVNGPAPSNPFDEFWGAYPKKIKCHPAKQAWHTVTMARGRDPHALLAIILPALELQKQSEGWTKDGGKYIPSPVDYLFDERWEDEVPVGTTDTPPGPDMAAWITEQVTSGAFSSRNKPIIWPDDGGRAKKLVGEMGGTSKFLSEGTRYFPKLAQAFAKRYSAGG